MTLLPFVAGLAAGILANVVASVLEKWLEQRPGFGKLSIGRRLLIFSVVFIGASAAVFYWPTRSNGTETFEYSIRVQAKRTGLPLSNAKVALEAIDQAPLDEVTDSNGVARFFINDSRAGQPARLIVQATGYRLYTQNIDLTRDILPDVIQLEDEAQSTPASPSSTTGPPAPGVFPETESFQTQAAGSLTPSPAAASRTGTPAPSLAGSGSEPISAINAARVEELARWGRGTANAIAWSSDGKWLAVAGSLGIYLYDSQTMEQTHFIERAEWVTSVAFNHDSSLLASVGNDGIVRLWRVSDQSLVRELEIKDSNGKIAFNSDWSILASGSGDDIVRLWRVSDGALLQEMQGPAGDVTGIAFSPDGSLVAAGGIVEMTVRLWRVSDGTLIRELPGFLVGNTFSHDGSLIALGVQLGKIQLRRVSDGSLARELPAYSTGLDGLAFKNDDTLLASAGTDSYTKHTIRLWRLEDGSMVGEIELPNSPRSVEFSPSGALLASLDRDGKVSVWRVSDKMLLAELNGYQVIVRDIAFSPDETLLASGGDDGIIRIWQVKDGALLYALDKQGLMIDDVIFSPDGTLLASKGLFGPVQMWRVNDRTLVSQLKLEDSQGDPLSVASMAFNNDWSLLATGDGDNTVYLWRASDWTLKSELQGHTQEVFAVAFSQDGSLLASADFGGTIRLWRVSDGTLLHELEGHTSAIDGLAFSPDGRLLASAGRDPAVRLWNVSDGTLRHVLQGGINSVAFSPDGSLLASGGQDNTLRLWRVDDGTLLLSLSGHKGLVFGLAFNGEGNRLVTGSSDGTIRFWGIKQISLKN